ncbi:MAG: Hpt domain-containing protein, partial [Methylophaga sp.]|nr:Hpt domain-containing protein [Methylophaga sp.]
MTMTAQQAVTQSALFIEEGRQLLLQIEQGWQQAKPGDEQWRGQMLRQLHQLKGMALSFDATTAADCCHQLESQLNQHHETLSPLQAVTVSQTLGRLHEMLHSPNQVNKPVVDKTAEQTTTAMMQRWQIDFKPLPGFFVNGQDPLQFLKQLQQLGEITVQADTSKLPGFADFDASQSYLNWQIQLTTTADEQTLRQVFDWVTEVCELKITALTDSPSPTNP